MLVILFLVAIYPIVHFVAIHFYLNADTNIYKYIPQDSDIVIEINSRNFIKEVMYQKIFRESYFNETLFPPEDALGRRPTNLNVGINVFSKVIVVREQWAEVDVWLAIVEYNDKAALQKSIGGENSGSKIFFGDEVAVIHLNARETIDGLDDHLQKIAAGEVKSFTERVDLVDYFDPDKEINVYLLHDSGNEHTQLLDGRLSYDFLADRIDVDGEFTPVSGFESTPPIIYEMNEDAALSIRSSISLFNSLYWFGKNRIENLPEYNQMAFDYNGVLITLCDMKLDLPFPAKQFPEMQLRFDVQDTNEWRQFIDNLVESGQMNVDTTVNMLSTNLGTFVRYRFEGGQFELMREDQTNFVSEDNSNVYFDFRMEIDPLLDNTKLAIDEDNPPNETESSIALGIASNQIADLKLMTNVESMWYTMRLEQSDLMSADGEVIMKNKSGSSIIECVKFASSLMDYVKAL